MKPIEYPIKEDKESPRHTFIDANGIAIAALADAGDPYICHIKTEKLAVLVAAANREKVMRKALGEVYRAYLASPDESCNFDWDAWGVRAATALKEKGA